MIEISREPLGGLRAALRRSAFTFNFMPPVKAVTIEIPEAFAGSVGATDVEAAKNARLELAIQMYRVGKWSTRRAGEFTGLNRWQFMEVLMARQVPFPYTVEMLEQDFAYARSHVGQFRT